MLNLPGRAAMTDELLVGEGASAVDCTGLELVIRLSCAIAARFYNSAPTSSKTPTWYEVPK
jgi:hypothetical protein